MDYINIIIVENSGLVLWLNDCFGDNESNKPVISPLICQCSTRREISYNVLYIFIYSKFQVFHAENSFWNFCWIFSIYVWLHLSMQSTMNTKGQQYACFLYSKGKLCSHGLTIKWNLKWEYASFVSLGVSSSWTNLCVFNHKTIKQGI